jgi:hypothetical protein
VPVADGARQDRTGSTKIGGRPTGAPGRGNRTTVERGKARATVAGYPWQLLMAVMMMLMETEGAVSRGTLLKLNRPVCRCFTKPMNLLLSSEEM